MTNVVLDELVASARLIIDRDPTHHLTLGHRQAIWAAFGPRRPPDLLSLTEPQSARVALAFASVVRVVPLWNAKFPDETLVIDALEQLNGTVSGAISFDDGEAAFNELWSRVVHLSTVRPVPEVAVGFAAVKALCTGLFDEFFDQTDLDPKRSDSDDPERFDAAFFCAIAQAGGLPDDPGSRPEERLTFWLWWLSKSRELAENPSVLQSLDMSQLRK
jgi:hypothetical protein